MGPSDRNSVKLLIEISRDVKEADKIISSYYGFKTTKEKIAFLQGMFDVGTIGHNRTDKSTYFAMLNAVIHSY